MRTQVVVIVGNGFWQADHALGLSHSVLKFWTQLGRFRVPRSCQDLLRLLQLGLVLFFLLSTLFKIQVTEIEPNWKSVSGLHEADLVRRRALQGIVPLFILRDIDIAEVKSGLFLTWVMALLLRYVRHGE